MMQPELAAMPLPADGQSVELPLPLPVELPGKIKLGVFGKHIALFSGDKAEALTASLGKQELKSNGFFHMGLDYGLVADAFDLLLKDKLANQQALAAAAATEAEAAGAASAAQSTEVTDEAGYAEPTAAELKAQADRELEEMQAAQAMIAKLRGMRLSSGFDFTATGLEVRADMEMPKH